MAPSIFRPTHDTWVKVTHRCLKAVALWTTPRLFQSGVQLGTTSRKKVITTDASNSGWGALYEGNPAYGSWLTHKRHLHINCIKIMAVCLVLKTVLPALKEHLVLVRSENTMVVAYINHQGGLRSCPFDRMTPALGTERTPLTTSGLCAGQSEPRSGYVVKEQCSFRRMESTTPDGSDDLVISWQDRGRPLRLRRQLSLPNLFFQSSGMLWPTIGPTAVYMPSLRLPCYSF